MKLIIDLPPREQQIEFNRIRWSELLADRRLADLPYRLETNAHGQITMTPPPSIGHSSRQGRITVLLNELLGGHALPECPISTIDGVKAADVGWCSDERFQNVKDQVAFEIAPEICVEILSPSNTVSEIRSKRNLYFEAGAEEVWVCNLDGVMEMFLKADPELHQHKSRLCPEFPSAIS